MFTLFLENKYGQMVELTHRQEWTVKSVDGLDPPDAVINTVRNAQTDGTVFNSAYADNRQIIITLAINGDAEKNRIALYRYAKTKQKVRLYYQNGERNVYIDGYIQYMHVGLFEQKQVAQITIICTDPFFKNVESTTTPLESRINRFQFPFSISDPIPFSDIVSVMDVDVYNNGDVDTGAIITLAARGLVVYPKLYYSVEDWFELDTVMQTGDTIIINSINKQKSVKRLRYSLAQNLIGSIKYGSTWPVFKPSDNYLSVTAQNGESNLDVFVTLTALYEGV